MQGLERVDRAIAEAKAAFALIKCVITSGGSLKEHRLDIWGARSRLEMAILLTKLAAGLESEERRATHRVDGDSHMLLSEAQRLTSEAINALSANDLREALEKLRRARDLLVEVLSEV